MGKGHLPYPSELDPKKAELGDATTTIRLSLSVTVVFMLISLCYLLFADDLFPADLEETQNGTIANSPRFIVYMMIGGAMVFLSVWSVARELVLAKKKLKDSEQELVRRLGQAAEWRDDETGDHTLRVGEYCAAIAKGLGWNREECEKIRIAAMLHDIGKIGIPDFVMVKSGELSTEERQLIQAHTLMGSDILADSDIVLIQSAQKIASSHHERWDGEGYPYGLSKQEIPIEGRIAALADVFDALTSKRRYKDAWTFDQAVKEIKSLSGAHFDPVVVESFVLVLPHIKLIYEKFQSTARQFNISRAA